MKVLTSLTIYFVGGFKWQLYLPPEQYQDFAKFMKDPGIISSEIVTNRGVLTVIRDKVSFFQAEEQEFEEEAGGLKFV